mmetsp:Transcript_111506/g.296358  ORF Transcript_111506/g.296358 Transcript_111506/m.296358 type:complete len:219 (+) Transcript_111506:80-736(+)
MPQNFLNTPLRPPPAFCQHLLEQGRPWNKPLQRCLELKLCDLSFQLLLLLLQLLGRLVVFVLGRLLLVRLHLLELLLELRRLAPALRLLLLDTRALRRFGVILGRGCLWSFAGFLVLLPRLLDGPLELALGGGDVLGQLRGEVKLQLRVGVPPLLFEARDLLLHRGDLGGIQPRVAQGALLLADLLAPLPHLLLRRLCLCLGLALLLQLLHVFLPHVR